MDSVLEEDVTLPGTLSGCSGLVPKLPDGLEGISPIAGLGNGVLPKVSEETVSPTRARNMKDFENQITELKRENFNLKLRIYFLEERMQQEFDGPTEHIYKTNIELKVEVEGLKRELQEREQLLIKASKAVESLAEGRSSEVRRVKEDAQKQVQQVEDLLTKRIFLLEEDVRAAQAELEKAVAGTEMEKAHRLSLENKLATTKKLHEGDLDVPLVLEEKDRLIEELKLSLKSKEALIQCLTEEKSQMAAPDESVSSGELRGLAAARRGEEDRDTEAAQMERQAERNCFEERIQALQEDLREKEREIATEKKNSLKRDKAIQGLTMALKSKEKEVEELNSELKELSAAFAKAEEAHRKVQTREPQGSEDYEAALSEKAALLAELHSENLTKSAENRRLHRNLQKTAQELSAVQQEKGRLEKDLEAACRDLQKSTQELSAVQQEKGRLEKDLEAARRDLQKSTQELSAVQQEKGRLEKDLEAARRDLQKSAQELSAVQQEKGRLEKDLEAARRDLQKTSQELSEVQQEKGRLEKDLEAARQDKSEGDGTIHDLRNEVEKLRNEVNEREKAVENHYKNLLRESNKKLHSQEQVISRLTEGTKQKDKDSLLQKFSDNNSEAGQQARYLTTAEDLTFRSEDLLTGKGSCQQSPGSAITVSEEKQQLDYEELIQVLKKERDIYTHLVKSLQDSDSVRDLQAELDDIFALRQQLERGVLTYQSLRKMLEEQISDIRRREEPFSFYSDQTSYLSICLEEHPRFQVEHFSQEELKEKVADLIQLVKDLYTDNQHLKKTIFDLSCLGLQQDDRLESTQPMELLASKEDENTVRAGEDDGSNFLSDQRLEQSNKIIEDYSKGGCKNGYLRHTDSSILDSDGTHTPACPRDQSLEEGELLSLLAPFFTEKATLSLEARPDLLKVLRELLLEPACLPERRVSGELLDGKTKKTLEPMALQLRDELGRFIQATSFPKPHDELEPPWGAQLVKAGEPSRVDLRDASVQTVAMEGDTLRSEHGGGRGAWEETPPDATSSAEHPPENENESEKGCGVPGQQAAPLSAPPGTDNDAEKSHLTILIKPSWSLESICQLPATQEVVAQLQGQILKLQAELKEFKIHNKQLHQKLILAEAMMEGSPAPDKTLLKDSEIDQPRDCAMSPTCKEAASEDFGDPSSEASSLSSNSQLSTKASTVGIDQSKDTDTSNDPENLKQKIRDLETELEGYRNFVFQLQKHVQCSEAIITVLCGTEGAQGGSSQPRGSAAEDEMTFSSLHQVRYVKHMKLFHPPAPGALAGGTLARGTPDGPEQRLVGQQHELQKEQNLSTELVSEVHNLQKLFRDLSPSRYSSLVQSQARELSLQRQQIKDSRDICVVCRQHMDSVVTAFEEWLRASGVDRAAAAGFQEQLSQCAELLHTLEMLFLSGKSVGVEVSGRKELMERVEEDNLTCHCILPESSEPAASHALSDCDMSEKSSSLQDQKPDSDSEKTSVVANNFSQDLLMEHIQEIRSLKKRLEDSIKTNEKLRRQLERQGSEFDQGSSNIFTCGSELHSSLTSEIRFLRKQNQALNAVLAKGSRDKQRENGKLREALSRKTAGLEHLQQELARVQGESERLRQEAAQREQQCRQLLQELGDSRRELRRVREELKWRQQLLSQNDQLLQALRVELKVYERLDKDHRHPREPRAEASGEGWKGPDPLSHLHDLLTEIQALRAQLERSIDTNTTLQGRLEAQLAKEGRSQEAALPSALQTLPTPELPLQLDQHDGDRCPVAVDNSYDLFDSTVAVPLRSASETAPLSGNDVDSLSCGNGSSATGTLCVSRLVPAHHVWASTNGCHVLGLIEDYEALCTQIGQVQKLLAKMDIQIREAPSPSSGELGTKGQHPAAPSRLATSVSRAKLILEEAARLLTLLWRVSLPADGRCTPHCEQTGEMKAEITKLHTKLFEQEKKLQNTMKLLQLSKHQERVIFDQLVVTHKILRKARGNLELRPGGAHPGTSSPSRPGS
ncbi:CDK5 regulatory subunit-associated protein 2 isoform X2 [Saccopteryx leptura]|uniref:CDK5 regulatory subunit-associated protein 2 isoform X2 n=1 Tax=Saccopteryx leptura TaxID=249018 RepID=UPI00339CA82C